MPLSFLAPYTRTAAMPGVPQPSIAKSNRFLAALPPSDYALLALGLRLVQLEHGSILHEPGDEIEHIYFPASGMVSVVAAMHDGAMVETATVGRDGVICPNAALGSRRAVGRAVVQLSGVASQIVAGHFIAAAQESRAICDLGARYNDLLIAQVQQSVACNALHRLEQRLCRRLLQSHDCCDGDTVPLTQDFLSHMLGVRRTSVTIAAQLLQKEGMISYRRGQIRIVNRALLEKAACECYSSVREHIAKIFPQSA